MPKKASGLAALLWLASSLSAQGLSAYFPAASAPKAAKLLASIDQATATLEARRGNAWKAQLSAEAEAVEAYALIAASRAGRGPWASHDGSAKASDAAGSLAAARSRAKRAVLSLSSGEDGLSDIAASRDAAAEALAKLIHSSGIGGKSALALGSKLSAKSRDIRLFPEIAEIEGMLRKAGGPGARQAAAVLARRSAEGIALSLIASKARIVALAPGTEAPLERLEADSRAYRAWINAFPHAAYPSGLSSASEVERAAVAAGVSAFAALRQDRATAIIEAMAKGDGRDAAAAQAARRLAEIWQRSPDPRRRNLAAIYGIPEATMALFCFAQAPSPASRSASPRTDAIASLYALNSLEAVIADEEANPKRERGVEAALLFLERPALAAIARREERYAGLYAELSRRLGSIYSRAAEDASLRIESSPSLAKAAARALGAGLASLSVRAIDLSLPPDESGRRIAFVATATDASGSTLCLPIGAALAGDAYALAFAKASGIGVYKASSSVLLSRYGQRVVCAYDPEGCDDGLVVEALPGGAGPELLGISELEMAQLGGWRP